jgi:hypothetical protein
MISRFVIKSLSVGNQALNVLTWPNLPLAVDFGPVLVSLPQILQMNAGAILTNAKSESWFRV